MPRKLAVVVACVSALLAIGLISGVSLGLATPRPANAPSATLEPDATETSTSPGSSAPQATASAALGTPAPYCAIADQMTPYRAYADYARTYLDWTYALPPAYAPPDLTPVASAGFIESRSEYVRAILIADLAALRADAAAAGHRLAVLSGYRSYAEQQATFAYWVRVGGYDQALRTSARAGHSEHQLGTAIDFSSAGENPPWQYADWGTTPSGRWLAENAWRYGFVLSYPAGKSAITCYDYEPWHYRWVGRERAAALRQSGVTLREFLGS